MDRNRLAEAAEHYIVSRRLSEVFFFGFALTEPRFVPLRSDPSADCEPDPLYLIPLARLYKMSTDVA